MKIVPLMIALVALFLSIYLPYSGVLKRHHTIGMENTISPLLNTMTDSACYPEGADYQNKGESSTLIYKREAYEHCSSGTGNTLYARCYQAEWVEEALFYTPMKDVRLGQGGRSHSCIAENDVNIPYYDDRLANATLGVKYLVIDHAVN